MRLLVQFKGMQNRLTRTTAPIDQPLGVELRQCGLVMSESLGLPLHGFVCDQSTRSQLTQDVLVRTFDGAWCIHIFNTNQPTTMVRARIEPTRQRRYQGAHMQRTRGGGREAANVTHPTIRIQSWFCASASASSKPETKPFSTRLPKHQSPQTESRRVVSDKKGCPSGRRVWA